MSTFLADKYFCNCTNECWCMKMIPVKDIPPEFMKKIVNFEDDYLLQCDDCKIGNHDLTPKTLIEMKEIVAAAIEDQFARNPALRDILAVPESRLQN